MTSPALPSRATGPRGVSGTAQANGRRSLADAVTVGRGLPPRITLHGVGGIGKTSFAANAPKPVFLMSKLETGALSLMDAGLVPEGVAALPECLSWDDALGWVDSLMRDDHDYKTLVLDVANGFEKLCQEHVCARDFKGNWAGFNSFKAGFDVSAAEFRTLLASLDKLREARKMLVILLAHTKVSNFRNPDGPDYDRYVPDMHNATWAVTYGWSDIVIFANYRAELKEERTGKSKARGGDERFFYTSRTAAWDAKTRDALPDVIAMGDSGPDAWRNFRAAYDAARAATRPTTARPAAPTPTAQTGNGSPQAQAN